MTSRIDIRARRERGRGRKAFWTLAVIGLAVVAAGAGRDHRAFGRESGKRRKETR